MEALGNILLFIGLIVSLYGGFQLVRILPHLKDKDKRERFLKKGGKGLLVGFIIMMIAAPLLPPVEETEAEVASEVERKPIEADTSSEKESKAKEEKQKKEKEKQRKEKKRKEKEKQEQERKKKEEQEKKQKELDDTNPNDTKQVKAPTKVVNVPKGEKFVVVNDNIPYFSNEDISSTEVYHKNGSFDSLGRVTAANAVVGVEIMPAEERGSISDITPTGWNQARYAGIGSGGWLYNRSHLVGHQMTGNDEPENLMTGTRYFNAEGMLPIENFVANYVEQTENHVRYRVTPVFEGNNLLASGVYMEGFSIEDNGEGIMFNVYVPNVQPGVEIDYTNGSSVGPEGPAEEGEISPYNSGGNSSGGDSSQTAPAPKPEPIAPPAPKPEPEPAPAPESTPPANTGGGNVAAVDTNGNGTVTIAEAEAAGFSMPIHSDHWLYPYMIDRDSDGMVGE